MSRDKVILLQRGELCLSLSHTPDSQAVDMLCGTLWGSPGGIRYRHLDTREHIHSLPGPCFLQLHKGGELQGVLALSNRKVQMPRSPLPASYIRYFAFRTHVQRKGNSIVQQANPNRTGILKTAAIAFFNKPEAMRQLVPEAGEGFYAYVTMDNLRSKEMCLSAGFTEVGRFRTRVFSRLFPKRSAHARRAIKADEAYLRRAIEEHYRKHAFFPSGLDWISDGFWVLEVEGKIVAGLQAKPVHWQMAEMPGLLGKMVIKVLPHIPLLNRLLNPERFNFLAVDAVFTLAGHEGRFFELLSHVCAEENMYVAMTWKDLKDAAWNRIEASGRLGILNRLSTAPDISLIIKGFSGENAKHFENQPFYIWSDDVV